MKKIPKQEYTVEGCQARTGGEHRGGRREGMSWYVHALAPAASSAEPEQAGRQWFCGKVARVLTRAGEFA